MANIRVCKGLHPFVSAGIGSVDAVVDIAALVGIAGFENITAMDGVFEDLPIQYYTDVDPPFDVATYKSSYFVEIPLDIPDDIGIVVLPIYLGNKFAAVMETLDLEISTQSTNKTQSVARVTLRVEDCIGIEVGTDEYYLTPIRDVDTDLLTAEEELNIAGNGDGGASIVIKQSHPLPATILCLTANIGVSRS